MDRYVSYSNKNQSNSIQASHPQFPHNISGGHILKDDPYTIAMTGLQYKEDIEKILDDEMTISYKSVDHFGFNNAQMFNNHLESHIDAELQSTQLIISDSHESDIDKHSIESKDVLIDDIHSSLQSTKEVEWQKPQGRKTRSIKPAIQLSRTRTYLAVLWLKANYEIDSSAYMSRSVLFTHYIHHCSIAQVDAVNSATFGKIIRVVFPDLKTRRLGVRGNSRYHYSGIKMRTYLSHHWLLQSSAFSDLEGAVQSTLMTLQEQQNQTPQFINIEGLASNGSDYIGRRDFFVSTIPMNTLDLSIPIDIERLRKRMILFGKKYGHHFGDLYRGGVERDASICTDPHHTNRLYTKLVDDTHQVVSSERSQRIEESMHSMLHIFHEFIFPLISSSGNGSTSLPVRRMDVMYNESNSRSRGCYMSEFLMYYQHHMAELFSFFVNRDAQLIEASIKGFWDETCKNIIKLVPEQNSLVRLVIIIDDLFHQALCKAFMPNMEPLDQATEVFGQHLVKNYESWIGNSVECLPETMLEARMEHARNTCHLLKRRHALHILAASLRSNFYTPDCIKQMSMDWMSLDFEKIQKQAGWTCSCCPELLHRIVYVFCELLKINDSPPLFMEALLNLATTITDQFVPSQDKNIPFICSECYKSRYISNDSNACTLQGLHHNASTSFDNSMTMKKTLPCFGLSNDTIQSQQQLVRNQHPHIIQTYGEQYKAIDTASRQFLYRWSSLSTYLLKELNNSHGSIVSMNTFYLLRSFLEDYVTHLVELRVIEARRPLLYMLPNTPMILCKSSCSMLATLAKECKTLGTRMSSVISSSKSNTNIYCEDTNQESGSIYKGQSTSLITPSHQSTFGSIPCSGISPNISLTSYNHHSTCVSPTTNADNGTSSVGIQYPTMHCPQYHPLPPDIPSTIDCSNVYTGYSEQDMVPNVIVHSNPSIQTGHSGFVIQPMQFYGQMSHEDYLLSRPTDSPINITPTYPTLNMEKLHP